MIKRVVWMGATTVWLVVSLLFFLTLLSQPISAGHAGLNLPVDTQAVTDLQRLNLRFGASQNSLILELEDNQTNPQIAFLLSEINPNSRRSQRNLTHYFSANYQTSLSAERLNLSYNLDPSLETASLPSNCQHTPTVNLLSGWFDPAQPTLNGYEQKWKSYDFSDRTFSAHVSLPLYNNTTTSITDDCFVLEAHLSITVPSNLPVFDLLGGYNQSSCAGLALLGRGGDDWQNATTTWSCRDDLNLSDQADDAFVNVVNPPFSQYFIFIENRDDGKCSSRILLNRQSLEDRDSLLEAEWQDWHDDCAKGQYDKDKQLKRSASIKVVNTVVLTETSQESDLIGAPSSIASIPAVETNCDFHLSGVGFGYVICWILKGLSGMLHFTESVVKSQLTIEREDYEKPVNNQGGFTYKDAWRNMRDAATYAIVATALFMVISTALDAGFFKNYTVKKYLPRLVAGTILIQFSWVLGDFMIQSFTQLGDWLQALFFSAFPGAEKQSLEEIFDGGIDTLLGSGVAAAGIWGAWPIITANLAVGALLFFVGFLFLVARKYLIIFLLILTPLGLALWILPGNDKAWNFYAKFFFYLVAIYPIIALTIAAGKIFSFVIML